MEEDLMFVLRIKRKFKSPEEFKEWLLREDRHIDLIINDPKNEISMDTDPPEAMKGEFLKIFLDLEKEGII